MKSRPVLRVVFDTNVFTLASFPLLEKSAMRARCRERRIVPIYGHVFLEETLRAYAQTDKRELLVRQWLPFIGETVDRFPDDFIGIWHRELVQGCGIKTNIWMRKRKQFKLVSGIPKIPLDGTWKAWDRAQPQIKIEEAKRVAQREVSKDVRLEFGAWRKMARYRPRKHGTGWFSEYSAQQIDFAGKQFLPAIVACVRPNAVADRWAKTKWQYPYFTTYVVNMLYIAHYAMTKQNAPIDLNAQADLNLMTHLLHADAVVSNETGFFKTAFNELWRPQNKQLFTTEQFCDLLE